MRPWFPPPRRVTLELERAQWRLSVTTSLIRSEKRRILRLFSNGASAPLQTTWIQCQWKSTCLSCLTRTMSAFSQVRTNSLESCLKSRIKRLSRKMKVNLICYKSGSWKTMLCARSIPCQNHLFRGSVVIPSLCSNGTPTKMGNTCLKCTTSWILVRRLRQKRRRYNLWLLQSSTSSWQMIMRSSSTIFQTKAFTK